jgi:protein involved in polysaccharide export with SLBB domain
MPVPAHRILAWFLFVLAVALGTRPGLAADTSGAYRLGTGDKVRIAVFGEPELSVSEWVTEHETIPYPLLGEIQVKGLTPLDLERLIVSRLKGPYLVDPKVTVSVAEYRNFFVMGQVNRPGSYPYAPGLTVRTAISMAGGFTDRASRGKIYLLSEKAHQEERRVNENDPMGPGDTVMVKESLF